ncbi:uncharacterized protein LOC101847595 [Aplysia californica]|uniref:Uncharacterized protein LOC101847595 n=1 Tax=Aplysia californica TaxID=6500 RepID=A0ABM0JW47_APLCA|nr:uncharacterized protein LOC101847595 [Aplysia californica]
MNSAFRDTVYSTALEHLGPTVRRNQDWFDENNESIEAILNEKYRLLRAHQNDPTSHAKKDAFKNAKAKAIARLPQVAINKDLDTLPTEEEVREATKQIYGKALGPDEIPAEVYKAGGPNMFKKLTELFQVMWNEGKFPQQFKDANIIHIYKRKGNRQNCDNHRGISLLSIAGKILARVLLNRLLHHLEQGLLPETQCGFWAKRGTTDMIFAARQLQEKCQEQHCDLLVTFVDLTKAFDTVSREGLWRIMEKYGCPSKFITIVRQLHDGMMVKVLGDGDESDTFPVTNGVKQGCVLAPTLFSMVFSAMLTDAFHSSEDGIRIRYRTDGRLFNIRRFQAATKVKETVIRELLFADDCALNASTEECMQNEINCFTLACDNFGLTINTKKTEVLYESAPGQPYTVPHIMVKGQKLQAADHFTYLGSTLSRAVHIDAEINTRVAKASAAFGRLRKNVWERRGVSLSTKLETWTVYSRHAKQLNRFHLSCLRKILRIRWQDKAPDTAVLERAGTPSIYTILHKTRARWAGHVIRMADSRLPKQLMYGELLHGKRSVRGQKKRFKDCLKVSLKELGILNDLCETLAQDRPTWRCKLTKGAKAAEAKRIAEAKQKRNVRKSRPASTTSPTADYPCPQCGRTIRARIGLISHLRTHSNRQQINL